MATEKRRAAFFTRKELDILMRSYSELEHIFKKKSFTAAAAKEREKAWKDIAAQVNVCNPDGEKRTWQHVKMKYKNMVQAANRKRAEANRTCDGQTPSPTTESEEQTPSLDLGKPASEEISGGSLSSEPILQDIRTLIKSDPDGAICLEPTPTTLSLVTDGERKEIVFVTLTEADREKPSEQDVAGQQQEPPATSTAEIDTLPVGDVYKLHLLKKIKKSDKEMLFLDRQIRKADLEIEILEHQLKEIKKTK